MPRPDEGLIHTWLDGELDAADAARVEALVRDDREWAAAAAEARGLIAASARIVGALDHVPANVIPKTEVGARASDGGAGATPIAGGIGPAGRRMPWWTMRIAALLVVAVGTALVVSRSPDDPATPRSEMTSAAADAGTTAASSQAIASEAVGAAKDGFKLAEPARQLADDKAFAAAKPEDSPVSPANPAAASVARAAAEPPTRNEADALGRTAKAPQPSAVEFRAAPSVATTGAAAAARDESRRDRTAPDQRVALMMLSDSAGRAGAGAIAERIQGITTRPLPECFRETSVNAASPATIHRVDRTSDSTARLAAATGAPGQPRRLRENSAAPQMTVRGDTLLVGTAPDGRRRVALRITCPAP